ncbi:MAG: hypothetical protein AAGE18_10250 [Pseudomonadota bacterium]
MLKFLLPAALALLTACGPTVQTTSGAAYLDQRTATGAPVTVDPEIAEIAAIEPNLTFPARIGVARVVGRQLTVVPPEEAALFADFAEKNQAYGVFVPVSPLVAALIEPRRERTADGRIVTEARNVLHHVRQAAARQHLDAVLIYELTTRGDVRTRAYSASSGFISGAFLAPGNPSTEAEALVGAILLDVRNGYPYGTATKRRDLSDLTGPYSSRSRQVALEEAEILAMLTDLLADVDTMLDLLATSQGRRAS